MLRGGGGGGGGFRAVVFVGVCSVSASVYSSSSVDDGDESGEGIGSKGFIGAPGG